MPKSKKASEDTIYENVRVCCQHGKPCRKAPVPEEERLVELDKVVEEEDGTYENLDPKAMRVKETESTEDSSKKINAKEIYLGSLDWKKAEIKMTGRIGLYHPTEDAKKSLFLLLKKKSGFRHYRIIQKAQQKGMKLSVENGDANPKEYKTLDEMVKHYKKR